ncbi:MAG: hypothetical protein AAF989_17525, partial [Planctomycetota bacterium]
PSLMATAVVIQVIVARWVSPTTGAAMFLLLTVYSGLSYHSGHKTLLPHVRGLNSLLDYELQTHQRALSEYHWQESRIPLKDQRPTYLRPDDRVLLLSANGTDDFHLTRQSVHWSEPYAEAFALAKLGDAYLVDHNAFYELLDRVASSDFSIEVSDWLDAKQITLLVDHRDDADRFFQRLNTEFELDLRQIRPGVWRLPKQDRAPLPSS